MNSTPAHAGSLLPTASMMPGLVQQGLEIGDRLRQSLFERRDRLPTENFLCL